MNKFRIGHISNIFAKWSNEMPAKGTGHNGQHYDVHPQMDGIVTTVTSSHILLKSTHCY